MFAGFLLQGISSSARVDFDICVLENCYYGGGFDILGGDLEMPWRYVMISIPHCLGQATYH